MEDPNKPLGAPEHLNDPQPDAAQPVSPKKKLDWKKFFIGVVAVIIIEFVAINLLRSGDPEIPIQPPQTNPSPTNTPTAKVKPYTGDGFSLQYPDGFIVQTNKFTDGTLMINVIAGTDPNKYTGIDFPPDQTNALRNAIANGTTYMPQKTKGNQASYIIRNDFKTIKLGDHYFVRDYPVTSQGCFCDEVQYVTVIKDKFISFSMAKALNQPPDPKAPTLAPYQLATITADAYKKLLSTDKDTLIKKQFGDIESILATLKVQ